LERSSLQVLSTTKKRTPFPRTFFGCPPCFCRARSRRASRSLGPRLLPPSVFGGREERSLAYLSQIVWHSVHCRRNPRHDDDCLCTLFLFFFQGGGGSCLVASVASTFVRVLEFFFFLLSLYSLIFPQAFPYVPVRSTGHALVTLNIRT
jgi:hypothetical protein